MIGSGARSSWKTKATSASTLVAPSPKITGESHAYWLPPHVVSRISELTPRAISDAPSQSTWWRLRWRGRCSWVTITKIATIADRDVDVEDPAATTRLSTMKPPASGPMTDATPNTPPIRPV